MNRALRWRPTAGVEGLGAGRTRTFQHLIHNSLRPGGWRSWWLVEALPVGRIDGGKRWDSGKKMSTVPDNEGAFRESEGLGGRAMATEAILLTLGREFDILRLIDRLRAVISDWGVFFPLGLSTHVAFVLSWDGLRLSSGVALQVVRTGGCRVL